MVSRRNSDAPVGASSPLPLPMTSLRAQPARGVVVQPRIADRRLPVRPLTSARSNWKPSKEISAASFSSGRRRSGCRRRSGSLPGRPRSIWRRSLPLRILSVFNFDPSCQGCLKRWRDDTRNRQRLSCGISRSRSCSRSATRSRRDVASSCSAGALPARTRPRGRSAECGMLSSASGKKRLTWLLPELIGGALAARGSGSRGVLPEGKER